jgi:class 3 adenylate cyclase
MDYPLPSNESERFEAVKSYDIYGSEPEAAYDDLSDLAAQLTGVPISLVNIVGDERIWVKSRHGIPADLAEVPRGAVCCAHAVCRSDLLVVSDTHSDDRFKDLPFISTEPFVRFYAGMPLIDSGGYALGTLCIMDLEPRELSFEVEEGIRRLARQTVAQLELRIKLSDIQRAQDQLAAEKERADQLILNILPQEIAAELTEKGSVEPRHHPSTTIMFTDFVGFTKSAEQLSPRELIDDLHMYFSEFDDIVARHGLEKLKTIGDAYMCAGGLMNNSKDHAVRTCLAALEIQHYMARENRKRQAKGQTPWSLRVGIHTGNVMSGVVGKNKFTYDVWGDSVNVAARMESAGEAGKVNVSESTYQYAKDYFECEPTRTMDVKNKGQMSMHFLTALKPEFAADADGVTANENLEKAITGVTTTWSLPE